MKRGGQIGNTNARRGRKRLLVSFDGTLVELARLRMIQAGNPNPTDTQIRVYLRDIVKSAFATS